eukprot:SAG11_NODE_38_length_21705_cov_24.667453_3_plen_264_part_00
MCSTDATIKPKLQTIQDGTIGGCRVADGDNIGWWQPSSSVGGIGINNVLWDPACQVLYAKDKLAECPSCDSAYGGVMWKFPVPKKAAIGEALTTLGCGPRKYAISVSVTGECMACVWGCHFLAAVVLFAALYLVVGMELARRKGAGPGWRERLPHKQSWLELYGLVQDGWRFAQAIRDNRSVQKVPRRSASGGAGDSSQGHRVTGSKPSAEKTEKRRKKSSTSKPAKVSSSDIAAPLVDGRPPLPGSKSTASGAGGRWVHVPT